MSDNFNDSKRYLSEVLQPLDFEKSFAERQKHIENVLARYLNLKTVVALIGAGASIPLGYPSWNNFALHVLDEAKKRKSLSKNLPEIERYIKYIGDTGKEMSAQVILEECERLFSSKEENETKQSKIFREIVKNYFMDWHQKFSSPQSFFGRNLPNEEKFNKKNNPYIALLDLPIRRFITTNYDLEIERALLAKKRIPNELSIEELCRLPIETEKTKKNKGIVELTEGKSFSQKNCFCEELAKFPISRYEDSEYMVFHCHGRIDDIGSCVVTEDDFQEWYLRDKPECIPFRQALDLTLSSNPILIIGYGLGDLDLTRWLRTIAANRPLDKVRNPLFCINYILENDFKDTIDEKTGKLIKPAKWKNREEIEDECDALYLRYGLHVIPVYQADGITLCDKLIEIEDLWRNWWNGILLKPKFRKTPTYNFKSSSYYHYKIDFVDSMPAISSIQTQLQDTLDKQLNINDPTSGGLAVVIGTGGTGKSWSVQHYLQEKEKALGKKGWKFVFWSSYYANDVLTGIDRLVEYFDWLSTDESSNSSPDDEENILSINIEDRFVKLASFLNDENKEKTILVFDGIEKLLIPNDQKTQGESISPEIKKFFRIISRKGLKCKIILTSRLFPLDVAQRDNSEEFYTRNEIEINAPRCWSKKLFDVEKHIDVFPKLFSNKSPQEKEQKLSSLCSLVDGHTFCIALIRSILEDILRADGNKSQNIIKAEEKFNTLLRNIGNTPFDRRIYRVIQESINYLHEKRVSGEIQYKDEIIEKFIERISLFMHPIRSEVAQVCLDEVQKSIKSKITHVNLDDLLQTLIEKNLLQVVFLQIKTKDRESVKGYVVHPLVRNYVYQTLHKSLFTSLPSIQLSGLTSAMEIVDPGSKDRGVKISESLFEELYERADKPYKLGKNISLDDKRVRLDFCRGAYSVLRSRFCANTVTRWGDYRTYLKMLLKLYDTTRRVSEEVWIHNEPTYIGKDFSKAELVPLYADEIAWLYNEIGLASISMGNLLNAMPFREQGLEISRLIDRDKDGRYLFQSEFNLGVAYIHLGKLNYAMNYLNKAIEIGNKLEDRALTSRVKAYTALVKYLQGSLEEANEDFNLAYREMGDNPRAKGVFYCYHGELLLKLNNIEKAKEKIFQSLHIGESFYYPDLIAYARLAKGNLSLKERNYDEAQNEFSAALKIAKETKIRRLETGILSAMSRLSFQLNDSEVARQKAVESLKISNEYSLCLHQSVGLIVLGKALVKNGQRDLGIACLKSAKTLAKSQSYFLRMNEAEDELQKLNSL